MPPATALPLFIGTSSSQGTPNRGIYAARLDSVTGALTTPTLAAETPNPGFLALHPGGRVICSSGECGRIDEKTAAGAANAYAYNPASGALTALNQQPTGGLSVTHLAVDATARMLFTASYHGGQLAAFPVDADGRLGSRTASIQATGPLGPNKARQDKPHPHCVTVSPDNRFLIVCDLGLDRVNSYRIDATSASLAPGDPPFASAAPGAGPRHCKFSRDGRYLYVINELGCSITLYAHDQVTGALTTRQTLSTLPAGFIGENICAEIQIHPTGRFVYGSNRGHDSLAVFARDADTGELAVIEIVPCGGRHPRHFALSPDGAWIVCANRDTNNLTVFRVDPVTGRLAATPHSATVPMPTCVLFAPAG
jgi:6-phosphogluconolactonase